MFQTTNQVCTMWLNNGLILDGLIPYGSKHCLRRYWTLQIKVSYTPNTSSEGTWIPRDYGSGSICRSRYRAKNNWTWTTNQDETLYHKL